MLRKETRLSRTVEVSASAFAFGLIQGKFASQGGKTALHLPVDLLAGAGFHLFGLLPFMRGYAHHLHALGDGAMASFFTTTGYRVGERWARGGSFRSGIAGVFGDSAGAPTSGGSSIADKELESLVRAG
jgi:hypothetical protein